MLETLIFFVYGLITDMMAALYNKCVQTGKALTAGFVAVGITVFSIFVLQDLLFDFSLVSPKLWGFAIGNLAGIYVVVRYWKKNEIV